MFLGGPCLRGLSRACSDVVVHGTGRTNMLVMLPTSSYLPNRYLLVDKELSHKPLHTFPFHLFAASNSIGFSVSIPRHQAGGQVSLLSNHALQLSSEILLDCGSSFMPKLRQRICYSMLQGPPYVIPSAQSGMITRLCLNQLSLLFIWRTMDRSVSLHELLFLV